MSEDFLTLEGVSREFAPTLSAGDRLAARLGADVETRTLVAVDDVHLSIRRGETLGLVGESGCGKSTLGRLAAGILTPTRGAVRLDGEPVRVAGAKVTTRVQTVFQDPFASLDPRMKVGAAVAEGPVAHGLVAKGGARGYAAEWFERVGLDAGFVDRYPHQFSGGQRQRIAIARALAMRPEVLVCDEPVASLDVSIQAQIVNLFLELRADLGLTCLFISHDLSVVRHVSERLAVMYLGRVVEEGDAGTLFDAPAHPYTRGLLDSVPRLELHREGVVAAEPISGELPSPLSPPPGCHFAPRCGWVEERCRETVPALREVRSEGAGRAARCLRAEAVLRRPHAVDGADRGAWTAAGDAVPTRVPGAMTDRPTTDAPDATSAPDGPAARALEAVRRAFADEFPEHAAALGRYDLDVVPLGDGFSVAFLVRPAPGERRWRGHRPGDPPEPTYEVSSDGAILGRSLAR